MGWLGEKGGFTIHSETEVNGKSIGDMLKLQFNYSANKIQEKVNQIKTLAITLAEELDRLFGPYVDFGMAFGLDQKGKIWIFEANISQHLHCPLWLGDHKMYDEVIKDIVKYLSRKAMES